MEITGAYYIDCFNLFETKCYQFRKVEEMLRERLPSLVPKRLHDSQQLNILSVGSGNGEKDLLVLKDGKKRDPGNEVVGLPTYGPLTARNSLKRLSGYLDKKTQGVTVGVDFELNAIL